jgi:hypothetical protein
MRQHPRSALAHEDGTRTDVVEVLVRSTPQTYTSPCGGP